MTIDAAEIARLRDNIAASPEQLGFMSADELRALLDELEKAREAELLHDSVLEGANRLQIENADLRAELEKARAERDAAYARDFPQPSKSDEERAAQERWICHNRCGCVGTPCRMAATVAAIRAEATLAEKERCALRLDEEAKRHETAMDDVDPADRNEDAYVDHLVAAMDFRSIAAAIRKGE